MSQIEKQILLLTEEQFRVKEFLNKNGRDCTTAVYATVLQYRKELKQHINLLKISLEEQS